MTVPLGTAKLLPYGISNIRNGEAKITIENVDVLVTIKDGIARIPINDLSDNKATEIHPKELLDQKIQPTDFPEEPS